MKTVTLYVDTESNSGGGALLSAAMVSSQGDRWYEAIQLVPADSLDMWPARNVIPVLGKRAVPLHAAIHSLSKFLNQWDAVTLVMDNDSDARHISRLLATRGLETLVNIRFVRPPVAVKRLSKVPHNALSDAYGLMESMLGSTVVDKTGVSPRSVYSIFDKAGIAINVSNSQYETIGMDDQGNIQVLVTPVSRSSRTTLDRWTDDYNHAVGNRVLTIPCESA